MKSATVAIVTGLLAITLALMGIFMSLHNMKTTKEIEANITEEIAVSTESEAKLTYEEFWKTKNTLSSEAMNLLEYVKAMETISPRLLVDLEMIQEDIEGIRKEAINLPESDYEKIKDSVTDDNEWYQPIIYVEDGYELKDMGSDDWNFMYKDGNFKIKGHYWRTVAWSQNIMVDKNNDDVYAERTYTVIEPLKPAYMLISSAETPLQLVIIK